MGLKCIQITDIHLFAEKDKKFNGITTHLSFQNVLKDVAKKHADADLLLFTGDISEDGSMASYEAFEELVAPMNIPYYWIEGNHDAPQAMQQLMKKMRLNPAKVFLVKGVLFILLDSAVAEESYGALNSQEQQKLIDTLKKHPNTPTIIAIHHHLMPTGTEWVDKSDLQNKDEFFKIIDAYKNIKTVICGHIHFEQQHTRKKVLYYSTPATSFQIKLGEDIQEFQLDENAQPGYRVLEMDSKGKLHTYTVRIEHPEKPQKDDYYEA
ncbi:MAG: phosphodiesterase [Cytophagales bacterium]|nr:MAG: phosphodiesterase [Cytophagales bacterium]